MDRNESGFMEVVTCGYDGVVTVWSMDKSGSRGCRCLSHLGHVCFKETAGGTDDGHCGFMPSGVEEDIFVMQSVEVKRSVLLRAQQRLVSCLVFVCGAVY